MTSEFAPIMSGLMVALALIVSIGAQNAVVLRQGLLRQHVGPVVAVCVISDAVLQFVGVAGVAALIADHPAVETAARWAGAVFLLGYAAVSARRAFVGGGTLIAAPASQGGGLAVLTILAATWLNPHALVETTVVIGSIAAGYGADRWLFLVGSVLASTVWFVAFGYGARFLAPILRTERSWRIVDGLTAVGMVAIAATLVG